MEKPEPNIRRATEADAPALAETGGALFRQTYSGLIEAGEIADHIEGSFSPEDQRAELLDSTIETLLVELGGLVVGFAQVRQKDIPAGSQGAADVELWRIYVDRELHGRGVGQRLLGEVGTAARELGASGIWLGVWERNARAIAFYEKHGFEAVGHHSFQVGAELQRDVVMRASLQAL